MTIFKNKKTTNLDSKARKQLVDQSKTWDFFAVYSTTASELIRAKAVEDNTAKKLELLMDMTNETVGDAISDMLLVESILHARGWSVQDWNKSYQVGSFTNPH